jgi:hypothetical protein
MASLPMPPKIPSSPVVAAALVQAFLALFVFDIVVPFGRCAPTCSEERTCGRR